MVANREKVIPSIAVLTPYLANRLIPQELQILSSMFAGMGSGYFNTIINFGENHGANLLVMDPNGREQMSPERAQAYNFLICGSARDSEEEVMTFRDRDIFTARYSMFYGGPSEYTGRMPEDTGYALDMPKDNSPFALIENTTFLEGILHKDQDQILEGIDQVNRKLEQPIIVTPYFHYIFGAAI